MVVSWLVDTIKYVSCIRFKSTLPETNIAPENGWLEFGILVSYWDGLFSGAMLVSGRVV